MSVVRELKSERMLRTKKPGHIQPRTTLQHIIAAFCQQAAIAAAFAYCGWFALGKSGALILAAMAFIALAWRPVDAGASQWITNSRPKNGIGCRGQSESANAD